MSSSTNRQHPWAATQKGKPTLASVAEILSSSHKPAIENVVLMVGSGVSVAAGLPDFRSPKTGLYANLQKYNLPQPEAIFDIDFFRDNPQPFFTFSKELFPGNFIPTLTHTFFTMLNDKSKLLRCFTQNIDTLERMADLPPDRLVEAHGSFSSSQCIDCHTPVSHEWMKERVMGGMVAHCEEERCRRRTGGKGGLVKPDIVFFGEGLPNRFFERIQDLKKADLLIVLGTSLQVQPFASLIDRVPATCPRVLINLERVGEIASYGSSGAGLDRFFGGGMRGLMNENGFDFEGWTLPTGKSKEHIRDVFYQGRCDDAILELAKATGWDRELLEKHRRLLERLESESKAERKRGDLQTTASTTKSVSAEKAANISARKIAEAVSTDKVKGNKEAEMGGMTQQDKEQNKDPADFIADKLGQVALGDQPQEDSEAGKRKAGDSSL